MRGQVVALCTSDREGLPKYSQPSVEVAKFGFVGDFHCRENRPSFKEPGKMKPNDDRHITIVAIEALLHVKQELGITLWPGALGENISVKDVGDLSGILPGTRVSLDRGKVLLLVTGQNKPCKNLQVYHREMVKTIYGRRGLLCQVIAGIGETLTPNCTIDFLRPPAPYVRSVID